MRQGEALAWLEAARAYHRPADTDAADSGSKPAAIESLDGIAASVAAYAASKG